MIEKPLGQFETRLTFISEDCDGSVTTFSIRKEPLKTDDVLEWFETQVMPALGWSVPSEL